MNAFIHSFIHKLINYNAQLHTAYCIGKSSMLLLHQQVPLGGGVIIIIIIITVF